MQIQTELVLLPATAPENRQYGKIPDRVCARPDLRCHPVHFPVQVWYNARIRAEALRQIASFSPGRPLLVGFSKSALGAWNLTREAPAQFAGTLLFDAPVARPELPPWETGDFYANDTEWQADQPLLNLDRFLKSVPDTHPLVLISGALFHDEMTALSQALTARGREHDFLPRPHLAHRWDSGWLEEGLAVLQSR